MAAVKRFNPNTGNWEYVVIGQRGPRGFEGEKGDVGDPGIVASEDEPDNTDILWVDIDDDLQYPYPEGASFYRLYNGVDGLYLQGGQVSGGHGGSFSLPDYKVVNSLGENVLPAGNLLWVRVEALAVVSGGVLLPGLTVTGASYGTGTTLPVNSAFYIGSVSGYLYMEVGRWIEGGFFGAAPGALFAGGCIGNYKIDRV
jgi:hypothetical protein